MSVMNRRRFSKLQGGQRTTGMGAYASHKQVGHMAALTSIARDCSSFAISGPSTCGSFRLLALNAQIDPVAAQVTINGGREVSSGLQKEVHMFSEDTLHGAVNQALAVGLMEFATPTIEPMACDRWLARSLIHKAIRRGEVQLAWRALATLLREHPAGIWRALTIIAMEDVGVSCMESFTTIVTAGRDRRWRERNGGEWKVAAFAVQQLCSADHDQAVCDLFHHAVGSPAKAMQRTDAVESDMDELALQLGRQSSLIDRAIAALAIGGGLAEGQRFHDPFAVFELLADYSYAPPMVDVCRAAWRLSRCPLALLMPLVWGEWIARRSSRVVNDPFPPISWLGDLPGYAVDQFTRAGIQTARRLLARDQELQRLLDQGRIARADRHRTVGDLIFLVEGSPLARRTIWPTGDELRLPFRCLADTVALGPLLPEAVTGRALAWLPLLEGLTVGSTTLMPDAST